MRRKEWILIVAGSLLVASVVTDATQIFSTSVEPKVIPTVVPTPETPTPIAISAVIFTGKQQRRQ